MMMRMSTQELVILPDALQVTDCDRPVSRLSRWSDPVWRLDQVHIGAPRSGAAFYWPDDIGSDIIEIFKKVIWSALVLPSGKIMRPTTLANYQPGMAILGRFMAQWDYADLSEFDGKAVEYLASHVAKLAHAQTDDDDNDEPLLRRLDGESEVDGRPKPAPDGRGGGAISNATAERLFKFIDLMHQQRHALRKMGVRIGDVDILGGESPREWSLKVRELAENQSRPLPDEISIPLMIAVDRLTGKPADDVIEMQDRFLAACPRFDRRPSELLRRLADNAVAKRPFTVLLDESTPWHPELPLTLPDGRIEPPSHTVRSLVCMIRDVAILAILQQTGMRIGEIVALRGGFNASTGLPDCVVRMRSPSGARDLFYARSLVSKMRQVPDPELWLLGCVPAGSQAVPGPVRAIQILTRLLDPWRPLLADLRDGEPLLLILTGPGLPGGSNGVNRPTVAQVSDCQSACKRDPRSASNRDPLGDDACAGGDGR